MHNRKIMQFIDIMERARAAYYKTWADTHYGLLATAAEQHPIAWQSRMTDNTVGRVVDRDIATIDKGYYDIGEAVKR